MTSNKDIKSYSPCEAFIGKYNPKNPLERSFEWKGGPRSLGEYKIDHFEFYLEHKSKQELERLRSEQMLDADHYEKAKIRFVAQCGENYPQKSEIVESMRLCRNKITK